MKNTKIKWVFVNENKKEINKLHNYSYVQRLTKVRNYLAF